MTIEIVTRPSILCVAHQMSGKKRNYSVGRTVPYEMINYKWYLMVLGQLVSWYCLVSGGTGSVKGLYACIYCKKWRFGRVLPMPDRQTTEDSATQLV